MAFFKQDQKIGASSQEHDEVARYLHKVHDIERQLFDNVHNTLVVIDNIGIQDADREVEALRRYAKKLQQLTQSEKKHLAKNPKKLYKLETEELSLEQNLVSLLNKARKSLDEAAAQKLVESIDELLEQLPSVIAREEELLTQKS